MSATPHTAPVHTQTLDSFDPESMDQAVQDSSLAHTQLLPGRFQGSLLRARLGQNRLDCGSYNLPLLATGEMPPNRLTLGLISSSTGSPGILNGHRITAPAPVLVPEGAELNYRLGAGSQWFAFQIERDRFERTGISLPTESAVLLRCDPLHNQQLRGSLTAALDELRDVARRSPDVPDSAACLRQIDAHLLDVFSAVAAVAQVARSPNATYLRGASRLVRQASDMIHAQLDQPLRIGAICTAIGCDWKRLERAFLAIQGLTPKRFLQLARMARARRLLVSMDTGQSSVTQIAGACGLHHLGRFSVEYRCLFGEGPADTLSRTRP